MPTSRKKPSVKRTAKLHESHEMIDTTTEQLLSPPQSAYPIQGQSTGFRFWSLVAVVLGVLVIYFGGKGYIVAAMVNGKPVFRWDVNREMTTRFGAQTLENIISERLIADAATAKKVSVSQQEITAKTNAVVASLGPNVKLDDLLKYQGMTKNDFEHQIQLQLTVEKILGKDVAVNDKEIEEYIGKNKETMTATGEAALRGEAREALRSQKINEKMQPWFEELKKNATVVRLMK